MRTALAEPADRRIVIDRDLPKPGWTLAPLAQLVVPADMPEFGRDYLTQLDAAVTKAVATACISSESYRIVAASYRNSGDEFKARDADRMADRIELDPRLFVAGAMHTHTPDGTAKFYLHRYIELIEEQAK